MTKQTTNKPTACAAFYALPTPEGAVQLAIADARAAGHGTSEFLYQLNIAADQLAERDMLRNLLSSLVAAQDCSGLSRGARCARVKCAACDARALLEAAQ